MPTSSTSCPAVNLNEFALSFRPTKPKDVSLPSPAMLRLARGGRRKLIKFCVGTSEVFFLDFKNSPVRLKRGFANEPAGSFNQFVGFKLAKNLMSQNLYSTPYFCPFDAFGASTSSSNSSKRKLEGEDTARSNALHRSSGEREWQYHAAIGGLMASEHFCVRASASCSRVSVDSLLRGSRSERAGWSLLAVEFPAKRNYCTRSLFDLYLSQPRFGAHAKEHRSSTSCLTCLVAGCELEQRVVLRVRTHS